MSAAPGRVGLFTTCIASLMRPATVAAAATLIERTAATVVAPKSQTCCGQPALNAGRRRQAKQLVRKMADDFAACDHVVAPSGSCIGALRTHLPALFAKDEPGAAEVAALAARALELSEYLRLMEYRPEKVASPSKVAYHDCCAGLRELAISAQPRALLKDAGHELVALEDADVCCGFGGTFALKFGGVSAQMADNKCASAVASGAPVLAMGDLGCALNIEGRMSRRGDKMRVCHYAELLV